MKPSTQLYITFICGAVFQMSIDMLVQDYMGKEKYLQMAEQHWVTIPWAIWLIPATIALGTYLYFHIRLPR